MQSSLEKRLSIDPEQELQRLIRMFRAGEMPVFNAGMDDHFRIAKKKDRGFINHPPALGVSFGGTNTKVLLAEMKNGELAAHHATTTMNPARPVHLYEFFDQLLLLAHYGLDADGIQNAVLAFMKETCR